LHNVFEFKNPLSGEERIKGGSTHSMEFIAHGHECSRSGPKRTVEVGGLAILGVERVYFLIVCGIAQMYLIGIDSHNRACNLTVSI
jgi:hypothetical protein